MDKPLTAVFQIAGACNWVKIGGVVGGIVFFWLEIYSVIWKGVPFDMTAYGIALGAVLVGGGAHNMMQNIGNGQNQGGSSS